MQTPTFPARAVPHGSMRHVGALLTVAAGCGVAGLVLTQRATARAAVVAGWIHEPRTTLAVVRVQDLVEIAALLVGLVLVGWFTASLCAAAACATARVVGCRWTAGERLIARYAPAVVRRALLLAAGSGLALAGAALPATGAVEDDGASADLGWSATVSLAPRVASAPGTTGATAPVADAPTSPDLAVTSGPPAAAPSAETAQAPPPAPAPTPIDRPTGVPAEPAGHAVPAVAATVTVRPGDSLWTIAVAHLPGDADASDVAAAWPAWYAANAGVVGGDPDLIRPGQQLVPPTVTATETGAAR